MSVKSGTGHTASKIVEINSTDFLIFMQLQRMGYLQLSDFTRVWRIILMLLMSSLISKKEISEFGPKRSAHFEKIKDNIDEYYNNAFIPEISNSFKYILDTTDAIEADIKAGIFGYSAGIKAGCQEKVQKEATIHKFQNNLLELERKFNQGFQRLKLNKSHFLFIDNVDINLHDFSNIEYESCLKALANGIWDVNTNIFRSMPISEGKLKIVLSVRPDIFSKLNLHNQANKIRDNGVVLDWRTTYENYSHSTLYELCNRLLAYNNPGLDEKEYWRYYFPWFTASTDRETREVDDSFINCMRYSLSRPRDFVSIMEAIQNSCSRSGDTAISSLDNFTDNDTQNEISNYYIDEARDWCLYKYGGTEFDTLLYFFQFLNGQPKFTYIEYKNLFAKYIDEVLRRDLSIPSELNNPDDFLQLLYELNMICYVDKDNMGRNYYRYCYRERERYNLRPQVKTETCYQVHKSILKALNLAKY
jgi:hypothetical protein